MPRRVMCYAGKHPLQYKVLFTLARGLVTHLRQQQPGIQSEGSKRRFRVADLEPDLVLCKLCSLRLQLIRAVHHLALKIRHIPVIAFHCL